MYIPDDLKYTNDHYWIKIDKNTAKIGITDYAQDQIGDVVYIEFNTQQGNVLKIDEVFAVAEAEKTISNLAIPITGEVIELNDKLDEDPCLINSDPYGNGWMINVKITDTSQLDKLLDSDKYRTVLEKINGLI